MAEWIECSIGDLCSTISDTYKGNDEYVVLVNTSDVLEGKVLNHETVANKNLKGQFKKTFKRDDILYSEIRPANKRFAYIDFENTSNYIASTKLMVLRHNEKVLPEYLFALLKSNYVIAELQHLAETRSGTFPQITFSSELAPMKVFLPDKDTQIRIVSILSSIEQKIDKNNEINNNLLEQALAIYKDWFCDYALSDGILPENWKITTIDAISSLVTRGIAPKYDDSSDQIVLNQKCIRDHTIDISLSRRHLPKKINEKWISKGDLLINSTGTGTLGRVAQVWFKANNMTVDSHVTIVRPKDPILQSYIGFWGLSHESEIEAQHTGSTGQTELPRDRVKAMELPLPDEDTLSKFNELVIPMTSTVISNQEENDRLSQLRDALLPKLMSSELDVSDIDL